MPVKRNTSLMLEKEVITGIEELGIKNKRSRSYCANEILKKYLEIKR